MGQPLMILEEDHRRLESLKRRLGAKTKVQIIRTAMDALEERLKKAENLKQWRKATRLVKKVSHKVNQDFQRFSPLKRND